MAKPRKAANSYSYLGFRFLTLTIERARRGCQKMTGLSLNEMMRGLVLNYAANAPMIGEVLPDEDDDDDEMAWGKTDPWVESIMDWLMTEIEPGQEFGMIDVMDALKLDEARIHSSKVRIGHILRKQGWSRTRIGKSRQNQRWVYRMLPSEFERRYRLSEAAIESARDRRAGGWG